MLRKRLFVGGICHGTRRLCDSDRITILSEDERPDETYTASKLITICNQFADDEKTVIARVTTYYMVMTSKDWTNRLWDHKTRKQAELEIIAMLCVDAYRIDILEGDELKKHLAIHESNEHEEASDE